tara:strand:- start:6749 stop:7339 length:591 start_codon:yes stop_codon:yes gene_type:complete
MLLLIKKVSQIISILFNPLINSTITFSILSIYSELITNQKLFIVSISILFSSIIPITYAIYLKNKMVIKTLDIDKKQNRILPLSVGIVSYLIGFILLFLLNAPNIIQGLMFCYGTNTIIILIITIKWKVSLHSTAISGPLVALNYHFGNVIIPFYILIPIVSLSRVILGKHNIPQVVVGALIGVLMTTVQLYVLFF